MLSLAITGHKRMSVYACVLMCVGPQLIQVLSYSKLFLNVSLPSVMCKHLYSLDFCVIKSSMKHLLFHCARN